LKEVGDVRRCNSCRELNVGVGIRGNHDRSDDDADGVCIANAFAGMTLRNRLPGDLADFGACFCTGCCGGLDSSDSEIMGSDRVRA